jgi:hypothetical protein
LVGPSSELPVDLGPEFAFLIGSPARTSLTQLGKLVARVTFTDFVTEATPATLKAYGQLVLPLDLYCDERRPVFETLDAWVKEAGHGPNLDLDEQEEVMREMGWTEEFARFFDQRYKDKFPEIFAALRSEGLVATVGALNPEGYGDHDYNLDEALRDSAGAFLYKKLQPVARKLVNELRRRGRERDETAHQVGRSQRDQLLVRINLPSLPGGEGPGKDAPIDHSD